MELKRGGDGKIKYATVKDLLGDEEIRIEADKYVVCAGAILTPGILWKSGFKKTHPALGRFLTEQTLAFCQVILKSDLVKNIPGDNLGCQHALDKHKEKFDEDPVPFPFEDDDPQIYLPVTEDRLWHAQIHRDAFSYGQTPPGIDQRLVVDLRFFGPVKPTSQNRVEFSDSITDAYGMPQPTFYYKLSTVDACIAHDMMSDMIQVARHLGGWVPGSEPKMLEPGASLHICGTTRAGTKIEDSVVNDKSQVWKCENLYLGGCNVVPGPNASNPTLTAMCFALEGAEDIIKSFKPAPK
ncbi:Pyranose 2-oxidase [Neofusicoccum parvum]|nr:Pyranose 2-oxidase [Neofusicoccum parvum]